MSDLTGSRFEPQTFRSSDEPVTVRPPGHYSSFDKQTYLHQKWSRGHKAPGQGQSQGQKKCPRPMPRTDLLKVKNRNARGQGQRPKAQAQVFSKKKSSKMFFWRSPKKGIQKFFSGDLQNFNNSKNTAVLELRTGQFSRN